MNVATHMLHIPAVEFANHTANEEQIWPIAGTGGEVERE
jgi:hypothetical protein